MNTISSTFDENLCNCTILGSCANNASSKYPVSVLLLNRNAGNFKFEIFENLLESGFSSIISIESPKDNFKVVDYSKKYPQIQFVIPEKKMPVGDLINLGMSFCQTRYLLVLWDDIAVKNPVFSDAFMEKFYQSESLCVSPLLSNSRFQNLFVRMTPAIEKFNFSVKTEPCSMDFCKTLYPFDYVGLYDCKKFASVGGFDSSITSDYWQLLDFALRSWLWGEDFRISTMFRLSYLNNEAICDQTIDDSYFRFFLKSVAPCMKIDCAYLPIRTFVTFHRNSNYSFGPALSEFFYVKKWVSKNKFRFRTDLRNLIENWDLE